MMNTRSGNQASGLILGPVAPRRVRRAAPPAPAAVPGPFEEALVSWGLRLLFVLLAAGVAGCKAYSEVPSADVQPPVCPPTPAGAEACWEPPAPLGPWRYIIVHHSATPGGSAALFEKYHRNVRHFENGMGYHFVIGNGVDVTDGLVEVGDRWVRQIQGAHVGGELNRECIGICLVGDFSQGRPTARQVASLDRLLKFLLARCRIPPSRVIGHCEARPGHTVCPGQHFSMDALRKTLSGGSSVCQIPVEPAGGQPPPAEAAPSAAPPPAATGGSAASAPQNFRVYGSVRSLR